MTDETQKPLLNTSFSKKVDDIFKKPKKNIVIGFVVLIILLVLGGAVLATKIWDPVWSPFRMEPEIVAAKMMEKMKTVQTISSEINFSIENQRKDNISAQITIDTDRKEDFVKQSLSFLVSVQQSKNSMSLSGESIILNEDGYIKINDIPLILNSFLGPIQGQWFKYDQKESAAAGVFK